MLEPHSRDDPRLKELCEVLIEWINDELAPHRIIVQDIEEDLYDGQVFQKLLGKLQVNGRLDGVLDSWFLTQTLDGIIVM